MKLPGCVAAVAGVQTMQAIRALGCMPRPVAILINVSMRGTCGIQAAPTSGAPVPVRRTYDRARMAPEGSFMPVA